MTFLYQLIYRFTTTETNIFEKSLGVDLLESIEYNSEIQFTFLLTRQRNKMREFV